MALLFLGTRPDIGHFYRRPTLTLTRTQSTLSSGEVHRIVQYSPGEQSRTEGPCHNSTTPIPAGGLLAPSAREPRLLLPTRCVGTARTPQAHLHTCWSRFTTADVPQMRRREVRKRADKHGRLVQRLGADHLHAVLTSPPVSIEAQEEETQRRYTPPVPPARTRDRARTASRCDRS